jgi:RimJ/RimL family protein N-acetyltransferase
MENNIQSTDNVQVVNATEEHLPFAEEICRVMEIAAHDRGTGIAKRTPEYVISKIREGKAVIALSADGRFAGFCYIEHWEGKKYVANSGLIVSPDFRGKGLAFAIKQAIFKLSRKKYPNSKIFGITTSPAVLKINSKLGYRPVGFLELTQEEAFWKGCESCRNYDILQRTKRHFCLCTGMLYDPNEKFEKIQIEVDDEEPEKSRASL